MDTLSLSLPALPLLASALVSGEDPSPIHRSLARTASSGERWGRALVQALSERDFHEGEEITSALVEGLVRALERAEYRSETEALWTLARLWRLERLVRSWEGALRS